MGIDLSKLKTNISQEEARLRRNLNQRPDTMKVFIYLCEYQPINLTQLTKVMSENVSIIFSRDKVKYALRTLSNYGLIDCKPYMDNEDITSDEKIVEVHTNFISHIRKNLQANLNHTYYYNISEQGKKFVDFVCKKLGLK